MGSEALGTRADARWTYLAEGPRPLVRGAVEDLRHGFPLRGRERV